MSISFLNKQFEMKFFHTPKNLNAVSEKNVLLLTKSFGLMHFNISGLIVILKEGQDDLFAAIKNIFQK